MIDSKALLKALQLEVPKLEANLRKCCEADPAGPEPIQTPDGRGCYRIVTEFENWQYVKTRRRTGSQHP